MSLKMMTLLEVDSLSDFQAESASAKHGDASRYSRPCLPESEHPEGWTPGNSGSVRWPPITVFVVRRPAIEKFSNEEATQPLKVEPRFNPCRLWPIGL